MADFKKQCLCIKFCIQFGKTAPQKHEMLKTAFGYNVMDSALPITCFYLFRRGENAVVD
jgi:hypothetical protein